MRDEEITIDRYDERSLREMGADVSNQKLRRRYAELRMAYVKSQKGQLPLATLLELASRFQLSPIEWEVDQPAEEKTPIKEPKKQLAGAGK